MVICTSPASDFFLGHRSQKYLRHFQGADLYYLSGSCRDQAKQGERYIIPRLNDRKACVRVYGTLVILGARKTRKIPDDDIQFNWRKIVQIVLKAEELFTGSSK